MHVKNAGLKKIIYIFISYYPVLRPCIKMYRRLKWWLRDMPFFVSPPKIRMHHEEWCHGVLLKDFSNLHLVSVACQKWFYPDIRATPILHEPVSLLTLQIITEHVSYTLHSHDSILLN